MEERPQTEEYLDTERLLERIPYSKRELETLIADGHLLCEVHFRRPKGPGTKRIFFWSAIEAWMRGEDWELRRQHMQRKQERERKSA